MNLVQTSGGAEVKVPGAEPITQERPVSHCCNACNYPPVAAHLFVTPAGLDLNALLISIYVQVHLQSEHARASTCCGCMLTDHGTCGKLLAPFDTLAS